MKGLRFLLILMMTSGIVPIMPAHAGLGDFLDGIKKAAGLGGGLSESKIIEGLKEALQIGTGNAVKTVSEVDGYYKNPNIRIPLPAPVQKVEKAMRALGYGPELEEFELSMNRAAERAAPEAKTLFWDTIKQMTFADGRKILDGGDNEATLYFQEKTEDKLGQIFKPIVHKAMSAVDVTRLYQDLDAKVRTIPFADTLSFDLDQYVTDGALGGLFSMLAEEERKIRQDPAARVTDLLKEVFGGKP
jgi:hypothetical protein